MPTIIVSPLKTIGEMAGRHQSREMISLIAEKHDFHRPGIIDPTRHLTVTVNDIAFAGKDGLIAPAEAHVQSIIDFVRGWDQANPLLIHCWMGVSRSPAAALIAALAVEPDIDDDELARRLRAASPQATPNTRLVEIGDAMLGRSGRLIDAVKAIGRGSDYVGEAPFKLEF
ncbi:tyrosine phosphatase family protein [Rhizobium sp. KVB221]|uniref:Tyrosine phosphatase family protein n=1 Tax=Rhizobium setariae TaxID=2801340 RepID=A0A937CL35_9HYPH|nr:tyrosine phosphatase family protein [Rhizobium setariae]MBL0371166.1 tyrosine phosphatase family protein [Rhizobium setariae]